jgi:uncharacterized protein (DUF302 family)
MATTEGLITRPSPCSVIETLDKLEALLKSKGVKVFTRIDHSGEAEAAGLHMPPTQVLIFGNPKGGTPVMLAAPLAAIDLPLKALAWQDTAGKTWLTWNDPEHLRARYNLSAETVAPLVAATHLIELSIA